MFKLVSKFKPSGDQPQAIRKLTANIKAGERDQALLGVTGSGKTFSVANVIEKTQMPTLVISHNKTLAAQLYQEFKDFFPNNAVHYFVSYYDYYQPEAYLPATDTYIEKDAKINEEIDRLRHSAAQDLLLRKDIIVVASVSCIYNIGSPENYENVSLEIKIGQKIKRQDFLCLLVALQYQRNDYDFKPGAFRVRGEIIEICLVTGDKTIKVEFSGAQIESIQEQRELKAPSAFSKRRSVPSLTIFPAKFWVSPEDKIKIAITQIKKDLEIQLALLKKQNKLVEAQRLAQRTNYDLEMIQENGYCSGIENYSRYFEFREPNTAPFCLLDYFLHPVKSCEIENFAGLSPKARAFNRAGNFLTIIDESHITIPQLHAMYNTDRARKNVLIEHGFRLPSCLDNRPLKFEEFAKKAGQTIYVSATPGEYEMQKIQRNCHSEAQAEESHTPRSFGSTLRMTHSKNNQLLVEQLVRPTGLLEPRIEIRPLENQVKNLIDEIKKAIEKNERVLAITLTKRMAEDLAEHLKIQGIKAQYLHSEIKTMERPEILNKLRSGEYDVLIGINLLREGLDLPEVGLVAILDADKEGFLRNETTLIQTMGRASRNLNGRVILYADKTTGSMKAAVKEIERRRKIQKNYNTKHNITPQAISKAIKDWQKTEKEKTLKAEFGVVNDIKILKKEMQIAAANLDFERAAQIRDLIKNLGQT